MKHMKRMSRNSGILLHISSLPAAYGIGSLGKSAFEFVDFLAAAGQSYWQLLPMNPIGKGNSPYQSSSVFAGEPLFIDLDLLIEEGLLDKEDMVGDWGQNAEQVDFALVTKRREPLLRKAFSHFVPNEDYERFCWENRHWLDSYSLYQLLHARYGCPWQQWPEAFRRREPQSMDALRKQEQQELQYHCFLQYQWQRQWERLKRYANDKGVQLFGDVPIYTAEDSADTWAEPEQFQLDERGYPQLLAGVPPDAFSEEGQLWGNPLYDWQRMEQDGYDWWLRRLQRNQQLYDVMRLDHFRGMESYYAVPATAKTAKEGTWKKGPGVALFCTLEQKLGPLNMIAEDLGIITPEVEVLRRACGFPGMKILQFAFDPQEESSYLPHNCAGNTVVYTGTHDNNTILGWFDHLSPEETDFVCRYLNCKGREDICWALLRAAWACNAELAMAPMQDLLELPESCRMNLPGTAKGNWGWRMRADALSPELAKRLLDLTQLYFRDKKGSAAV